jgi:hypothetical protein
MSKITEEALQQVRYADYGLILSIRYVDKTDDDTWKIALWLNGSIGREIQINVPRESSDESVTKQIVEAIESNLPEWRKFVTP